MRWRLKTAGADEPVEVSLLSVCNEIFIFKVGKETISISKADLTPYSISDLETQLSFEVWNSKKWKASTGAHTYTIEPLAFGVDSSATQAEIRSEMPGRILKVLVKVGDKISANQPLVIMEAMKMENEIRASGPGVVKTLHTLPGQSVESGTVLIELEAT